VGRGGGGDGGSVEFVPYPDPDKAAFPKLVDRMMGF